jgi:hypothetical protein
VSMRRASRFVTQVKTSSLIDVVLVRFCEGLDPPNLMRTSDVGYVPYGSSCDVGAYKVLLPL